MAKPFRSPIICEPQISSTASGAALDQERLDRLTQALEDKDIAIKQSELDGNSALIRLERAGQQVAAREIIDERLGDAYTVALNLADAIFKKLPRRGMLPFAQCVFKANLQDVHAYLPGESIHKCFVGNRALRNAKAAEGT